VLEDPLPWIEDLVRAQRPQRLPVVLTRDEVESVLQRMEGTPHLVARLLYGTGVRLLKALRLRVKDKDFVRRQIMVRDPKGRSTYSTRSR
jgi:integrase